MGVFLFMADNLFWQESSIKRENREALTGQKAKILWFTGLSGAGKSTIANLVEKKLNEAGKLTYLLDGDNIRQGLNSDLGFSVKDRKENIRRITEVSKLFLDAGIITLTCFISPFNEEREKLRKAFGDDFVEIFVDCPLEVCESRDVKGLYKKARLGEIKEFTGISSPYEKPENPEIIVNTSNFTAEQCADIVMEYLI